MTYLSLLKTMCIVLVVLAVLVKKALQSLLLAIWTDMYCVKLSNIQVTVLKPLSSKALSLSALST